MDLVERFSKALDAESAEQAGDVGLLPVRLARAAAAVLAVDGAGLSVHGSPDLRTPLAGSSDRASLAERLQFTVGRGPCLLAAESGFPVFGTADLLARRWPEFHDLLVEKTRLRSVLALSLPGRLRGLGSLALFFSDPDGPWTIDAFAAREVAALVSEHLGSAADWSAWLPAEGPDGMTTPDSRRRGRLWKAVGMVMLTLHLPAEDALALLRARAYATDRTVDDLAADLVDRRLDPGDLRGEGDPGR